MNKVKFLVLACVIFWSCDLKTDTAESDLLVSVLKTDIIEGENVQTYELKNTNGTTIHLTNYGAIVTKMLVADRDGKFENIVLGFDSVDEYKQNGFYFGATIGRFANRIAGGKFSLDGKDYQLTLNNGPNHLHGGKRGFNEVVWKAVTFTDENAAGIRMNYISPDGEEGYPGQLTTTVTFTLNDDDVFSIYYQAITDKKTIVNLTHHGYFNLSSMQEDILDHELAIYGDHFTPVDETSIPTGEIAEVHNTPFDFTSPRKIGDRIDQVEGGYTLNYVITKAYTGKMRKQAELYHRASGRVMEVHSDAPGIQLYTGNFLNGVEGSEGIKYKKHYGLCLEPQFFPDSPNNDHFPSTIIAPGDIYKSKIEMHFKTR